MLAAAEGYGPSDGWHPYLPEPRPAFKLEPGDPEPIPLEAVRALRDLCADFRAPPQFKLMEHDDDDYGAAGSYDRRSDIVRMDLDRATQEGMGGEDGYYATLLHELLHATGHPSRLDRKSVGDMTEEGYALEEGTVMTAERIVLEAVGFPAEALDWFAPSRPILRLGSRRFDPAPVDREAAEKAAAWALGRRDAGGPA